MKRFLAIIFFAFFAVAVHAQGKTELTFYYPIAGGGPLTAIG